MARAEVHGTFFDQKPAGSQQGAKRGNEKIEKGETPSHVQHGKRRKCSCGKCVPSFGMLGGRATHCKECKDEGMVHVGRTSKVVYAHGKFWLRLMENFAEH